MILLMAIKNARGGKSCVQRDILLTLINNHPLVDNDVLRNKIKYRYN